MARFSAGKNAGENARKGGARPNATANAIPRSVLWGALARDTLRRVERLAEPPLSFALSVPSRVIVAPPDILPGGDGRAEDIYGGRFDLAGHVVETGGASPFAVVDAPLAWLRALHGFGWLRHAALRSDALTRANARALAGDWFREHGHPGGGIAWEPMVAAVRLRHWLAYSTVLLSPAAGGAVDEAEAEGAVIAADPGFDDRFLRQIAVHRRFLRRAMRDARDPLERLHALTSLTIAALALPVGRDEQRRFGTALEAELSAQILHDGGHVSRRASASVDLLAALMPLARCYAARGIVAPPGLLPAIDRMVPALRHHRMGDGGLARHNGTYGVRRDRLNAILALDERERTGAGVMGPGDAEGQGKGKAEETGEGTGEGSRAGPGAGSSDGRSAMPWPPSVAPALGLGSAAGTGASAGRDVEGAPLELPETGYQRLAIGGTVVVADTGATPPPEHAGLAHAGALSFEMSVGDAPLVVNLGGCEPGEPGGVELERALRSTAAHSTLSLDRVASARIVQGAAARRLFGEAMVDGPREIDLRRADAGDGTWRGFRAVHDGYAGSGLLHERVLMLRDGGARLNGTDRMLPLSARDTKDAGTRKGTHDALAEAPVAALRFHLHPAVAVELDGDDGEEPHGGVTLRVGGETWRFTADARPALEETLFCDGRPVASTQIVLTLGGPRRSVEWSLRRVDLAMPGNASDARNEATDAAAGEGGDGAGEGPRDEKASTDA